MFNFDNIMKFLVSVGTVFTNVFYVFVVLCFILALVCSQTENKTTYIIITTIYAIIFISVILCTIFIFFTVLDLHRLIGPP
jgi:hypothetical protein